VSAIWKDFRLGEAGGDSMQGRVGGTVPCMSERRLRAKELLLGGLDARR